MRRFISSMALDFVNDLSTRFLRLSSELTRLGTWSPSETWPSEEDRSDWKRER